MRRQWKRFVAGAVFACTALALTGSVYTVESVYAQDMFDEISEPELIEGQEFTGLPEPENERYEAAAANKCGDNVYWSLDSNGVMTISGNGKMWDFRNDAEDFDYHECPWAEQKEDIKEVVFQEGVTYVGADAFTFTSVTKVTFSNTITQIGCFAFTGCQIPVVTLPESLRRLGQQSFCWNYAITSIIIPDSVTFLDAGIFEGDTSLQYAYIGGTSEVGSYVYANCPFRYCTSLEKIEVSNDNIALTSVEGVLYDKDMKTLVQYPLGKKDTVFDMPDKVTNIYQFAIEGSQYLQKIAFSENLELIDNCAVRQNKELEEVYLSDKVASIESSAFELNDSLRKIYYGGTSQQWEKITIDSTYDGNQTLRNGEKIYHAKKCDLIGHQGDWSVVNESTTTTTGLKVRTCTYCGKQESVTIAKKPAAVSGLKAEAGGYGKVKLTWSKSTNAVGYIIYKKNVSTGKFEYCSMTSNTAYTDTKASAADYSFYRVYPYNTSEDGTRLLGSSNTYVYAKGTPVPVANLKAVSAGKGKVTLTWTKTSDVTGYIIYKKNSSTGKFEYLYMTSGTGYTDSSASVSDYNFYRVYPYVKDSSGKRVLGASNTYVYAKGVLAAPKNVKASKLAAGQVKLTWDKALGAAGYIIYRKTGDGSFTYLSMSSTTSFADKTAVSGTYNFYRIYAYEIDASGKRVLSEKSDYVYMKP